MKHRKIKSTFIRNSIKFKARLAYEYYYDSNQKFYNLEYNETPEFSSLDDLKEYINTNKTIDVIIGFNEEVIGTIRYIQIIKIEPLDSILIDNINNIW